MGGFNKGVRTSHFSTMLAPPYLGHLQLVGEAAPGRGVLLGRLQLLQHLDQSLRLRLLGKSVERPDCVDIVETGLSQRLVLCPDSLQFETVLGDLETWTCLEVEVGRYELVGGIIL